MGKRVVYTKITPLPRNVPRQLAIELLHSHSEVIELNPLVTGVKEISAPRDAPSEEYFSTWYEISEIITWGFGLGKNKIKFKGCFHDQPWGLQSHVYAPMGVDLRNKYRIGGNQPGEPREPRELGVETPLDGLYLREDVEIVCNIALASFVKKETIEATGKMIERLTRKAELLDEGKLHAMFEHGKLKTAKPVFNDEERRGSSVAGSSINGSPPRSPASVMTFGPRLDVKGYGNYHDVARQGMQSRSGSVNSHYSPAYQQQGYNGPETHNPMNRPGANMPMIMELQGSDPTPNLFQNPHLPQGQVFRSELPGDTSFTPTPEPSPRQQQAIPGAHDHEQDTKLPVQYQAYAPPPPIPDRSAQRGSIVSTGSNGSFVASGAGRVQQQPLGVQHNGDDRSSQCTADSVSARDSIMPTPELPSQKRAPGMVMKCPVCDLFEGDEAAVSYHVGKSHFA